MTKTNSLTKSESKSLTRIILFLIGCIGTKIMLSVMAKMSSDKILKIMGVVALIPAISFTYIFTNNLRGNGTKGMSGGTVWWNALRPIHACLYLLFAFYAIQKERNAWLILLVDAIFSLVVWYLHHFKSVEF
jgi:hypothetical protein